MVCAAGQRRCVCHDGDAPGNRLRPSSRAKSHRFFAAMRRFANQMQARGHRFFYFFIDDPRNRQCLEENLDALDNAIRYTPHGEIKISAQDRGDSTVECAVADNGDGIADDLQERVFDKGVTDPEKEVGPV